MPVWACAAPIGTLFALPGDVSGAVPDMERAVPDDANRPHFGLAEDVRLPLPHKGDGSALRDCYGLSMSPHRHAVHAPNMVPSLPVVGCLPIRPDAFRVQADDTIKGKINKSYSFSTEHGCGSMEAKNHPMDE